MSTATANTATVPRVAALDALVQHWEVRLANAQEALALIERSPRLKGEARHARACVNGCARKLAEAQAAAEKLNTCHP